MNERVRNDRLVIDFVNRLLMMPDSNELKAKLYVRCGACLFLVLVLACYLALGALTFHFIEFGARQSRVLEVTQKLEKKRAELLQVLWAQTIAKSEDDWLELANGRLDLYEKSIKKYLFQGIDLQEDEGPENDEDNKWTLSGSLFYCFTVITTIGYGNIAPATWLGKLLTIAYATLGIPLTLYFIAELAKLVTLCIKLLLASAIPELDSREEFTFGLLLSLSLAVLYLLLGSLVFWQLEGWSLLDACYFNFVTCSTIGFGDLVPRHLGYALLLIGYTFSALALLGACFTAMQGRLEDYLSGKRAALQRWWRQTLGVRRISVRPPTQQSKIATRASTGGSGPSPVYVGGSRRRYLQHDEEEEEEDS